ncbi:DUF6968 family protein [Asticcacaulis sp. W401b]|uniref:DUF6968 family protein n=1 Tax=Asticcacaulis sp. W401b TaxID=3388666 RepID=UPI00397065C6
MDHRKEDAILHRQFELDEDKRVDLYVWWPFAETDARWACTYLIEGLGAKKPKTIYGIDAVQALCLCLKMAATVLYVCEPYKAGRLTWSGSRDLGLPMIEGLDPATGNPGQAQLLTTAGQSAVLTIPGCALPYIAFPGDRLARLTQQLRDISLAHPAAGLARLVEGLESELAWYEANAKLTPPVAP